MSSDATVAPAVGLPWKKYLFMAIGIFLFVVVYYSPPWPDAIDPQGKAFAQSRYFRWKLEKSHTDPGNHESGDAEKADALIQQSCADQIAVYGVTGEETPQTSSQERILKNVT